MLKILNKSDNSLPAYATIGSAGFDLRSNEEAVLLPGDFKLIKTGLFMEIPVGLEGQIRPRSGLAYKHGVTVLNSPGTIDSDYRGEIGVILINLSGAPFKVNKGDRIAQMVISSYKKVDIEEVEIISETNRGEGGFGSTGVK